MKRNFTAVAIEPLDQRLGAGDTRKFQRNPGRRPDCGPVELRSVSALGKKELVADRRKYRGEHRLRVFDQRDTDAPVFSAGQVGARAVDRVDNPYELAAKSRLVFGAFLGQPAV